MFHEVVQKELSWFHLFQSSPQTLTILKKPTGKCVNDPKRSCLAHHHRTHVTREFNPFATKSHLSSSP